MSDCNPSTKRYYFLKYLLRGRYCDSDKESSRTPDEEQVYLVPNEIGIKLAVEVTSNTLQW